MPLALIAIAFFIGVTAVKGNYTAVGTQFQQTFFGANGQTGFVIWFGSILGIAFIFRLINASKAGELFIALLLLVYILQHQSVLSNIESAIQSAGSGNSGGAAATGNAASSAGASAGGSAPASVSSDTTGGASGANSSVLTLSAIPGS